MSGRKVSVKRERDPATLVKVTKEKSPNFFLVLF